MSRDNGFAWKSPEVVENYLNGVRGAIPLAQEQLDVMMRVIETNSDRVATFIDLGCGDGILSSLLLERYPKSNGVLLDFSDDMIIAAKKKLSKYTDRVKFLKVDYGKKTWVNSITNFLPFDVVVSGFSIHHQPDERKKELYSEIYGMLNSKGIFINIEHVSSKTQWIASIMDRFFIDSLYEFNKARIPNLKKETVEKQYHNREDKKDNILAPVDIQCKWLEEIGFKDVDCYLKIFEIAVFGGRK